MIVYRICKTYPPDHNPLDGVGSSLRGGRWNPKGIRAVYASESLALAKAELARQRPLTLLKDYSVYEIEIADNYLISPKIPEGWDETPPTHVSKNIGAENSSLVEKLGFFVPSVADPCKVNVVLNPLAKDFSKYVSIKSTYPFLP
ncbi:MAG: RES domain-containing protein [Anditalea sp.]